MKENMTQEEKRAAYYKTPQRLHVYESTDKAKEIVQKSMAIDTLFSGVVPLQWSTPQAPEFHDEMDKIKAAGFKTIGACTTADALGASFVETMKALELYLAKFHERPDKYQLVRTAADIDKAIAEDKLGIYFTHQGFGRPSRPDPRYATLKELNVDGRKPLTRVTAH